MRNSWKNLSEFIFKEKGEVCASVKSTLLTETKTTMEYRAWD